MKITDILLEDVVGQVAAGPYTIHSERGGDYIQVVAFRTNDPLKHIVSQLMLMKNWGFWEVDDVVAIHGFPAALHATIEHAEKMVGKKLKNTNRVTYRSLPFTED